MDKKKAPNFLLKVLIGSVILTPTYKAHAEEVKLAFDVNVAKAEDKDKKENTKEQPLVTEKAKEEAKKQQPVEENSENKVVETNNAFNNQTKTIENVITPTLPSTATGKIVSEAKDENNKDVKNKKQREFIEFTTRNNKKLYLIIDRADSGQEVKLVTEVSEQDLASMINGNNNTNKTTKVVEAPKPTTNVQKEKKDNSGISIFVYIFGFAILGALGFVIYIGLKKRQKKGQEDYELEELEDIEADEYDNEKK